MEAILRPTRGPLRDYEALLGTMAVYWLLLPKGSRYTHFDTYNHVGPFGALELRIEILHGLVRARAARVGI